MENSFPAHCIYLFFLFFLGADPPNYYQYQSMDSFAVFFCETERINEWVTTVINLKLDWFSLVFCFLFFFKRLWHNGRSFRVRGPLCLLDRWVGRTADKRNFKTFLSIFFPPRLSGSFFFFFFPRSSHPFSIAYHCATYTSIWYFSSIHPSSSSLVQSWPCTKRHFWFGSEALSFPSTNRELIGWVRHTGNDEEASKLNFLKRKRKNSHLLYDFISADCLSLSF